MLVYRLHKEAFLPTRQHDGDAGYDIMALQEGMVEAGKWKLVSTGIAISVPNNMYTKIYSRSGLALKNGIDVAAGVIDSTYRGEVKVLLRNTSTQPFIYQRGDRIAQLVVHVIDTSPVSEVSSIDELGFTDRGNDGFGSTGN